MPYNLFFSFLCKLLCSSTVIFFNDWEIFHGTFRYFVNSADNNDDSNSNNSM